MKASAALKADRAWVRRNWRVLRQKPDTSKQSLSSSAEELAVEEPRETSQEPCTRAVGIAGISSHHRSPKRGVCAIVCNCLSDALEV